MVFARLRSHRHGEALSEDTAEETAARGVIATMRAHPIITAIMIGCALAGAISGFFLLPEEWLAARRLAAGTFAGAGVGLTITATKMIG